MCTRTILIVFGTLFERGGDVCIFWKSDKFWGWGYLRTLFTKSYKVVELKYKNRDIIIYTACETSNPTAATSIPTDSDPLACLTRNSERLCDCSDSIYSSSALTRQWQDPLWAIDRTTREQWTHRTVRTVDPQKSRALFCLLWRCK